MVHDFFGTFLKSIGMVIVFRSNGNKPIIPTKKIHFYYQVYRKL